MKRIVLSVVLVLAGATLFFAAIRNAPRLGVTMRPGPSTVTVQSRMTAQTEIISQVLADHPELKSTEWYRQWKQGQPDTRQSTREFDATSN